MSKYANATQQEIWKNDKENLNSQKPKPYSWKKKYHALISSIECEINRDSDRCHYESHKDILRRILDESIGI